MPILRRISKNKYEIVKISLGVQRSGKDKPKIYHRLFFIKSFTKSLGGKNYEYGEITMTNIKTPPRLIGKRARIILEIVEPCTKNLRNGLTKQLGKHF